MDDEKDPCPSPALDFKHAGRAARRTTGGRAGAHSTNGEGRAGKGRGRSRENVAAATERDDGRPEYWRERSYHWHKNSHRLSFGGQ